MDSITICQIILGVSIFGALFVFVRNLPLVPEHKVKYIPKEKRVSFKLKRGLSEKKVETVHITHKAQEKLGHRLRIWILKLDNFLSKWLKKTKERNYHLENIYFKKIEESKGPIENKKSKKKVDKRKKRG